MSTTLHELKHIVSHFKTPLAWAAAYGSAAVTQKGYAQESPTMIDFIFAVDDAHAWHHQNLEQNAPHYSLLMRMLGEGAIRRLQQASWSAGVYFNTNVTVHGHPIKYGVIEKARLVRDLHHWDTLYISGRMHKPMVSLIPNADIESAQQRNLVQAVAVAALLLPPEFSLHTLLTGIVGLSYHGDARMMLAENPRKVSNIVDQQYDALKKIYLPLLHHLHLHSLSSVSEDMLSTHQHHHTRTSLVHHLPRTLALAIQQQSCTTDLSLLSPPTLSAHLSHALKSIVRRTSLAQTFVNTLTAGPLESLFYVANKVRRRFFSRDK